MDYTKLSDKLTNAGFQMLRKINKSESGGIVIRPNSELPIILKLLFEKTEKDLVDYYNQLSGKKNPT